MRRVVFLLVVAVAILGAASASAMTLPTRVKMVVSGGSCRFSSVVVTQEMQRTLARRCSRTAVARVQLPRRLMRPVTVLHGAGWVITLQEMP